MGLDGRGRLQDRAGEGWAAWVYVTDFAGLTGIIIILPSEIET